MKSLNNVDQPHDDIFSFILLKHVLHDDFFKSKVLTEAVH